MKSLITLCMLSICILGAEEALAEDLDAKIWEFGVEAEYSCIPPQFAWKPDGELPVGESAADYLRKQCHVCVRSACAKKLGEYFSPIIAEYSAQLANFEGGLQPEKLTLVADRLELESKRMKNALDGCTSIGQATCVVEENVPWVVPRRDVISR